MEKGQSWMQTAGERFCHLREKAVRAQGFVRIQGWWHRVPELHPDGG